MRINRQHQSFWSFGILWGFIMACIVGAFIRSQAMDMEWWQITLIVLGVWIVIGFITAYAFGGIVNDRSSDDESY